MCASVVVRVRAFACICVSACAAAGGARWGGGGGGGKGGYAKGDPALPFKYVFPYAKKNSLKLCKVDRPGVLTNTETLNGNKHPLQTPQQQKSKT